MFGKLQGMKQQFEMMQRLMKDENFRAFISHPKVQELLKDPEFQKMVQNKDMGSMMNHPKMAAFRQDPELAELAKKLNFQKP